MKKLWSIFTDDMNKCIVTSAMTSIEWHHVFGGADRKMSEKYGLLFRFILRCIQTELTERMTIGKSLTIG